MRRQIRWTEKDAEGKRMDVRVSFHGVNIKWQFKRVGMQEWDYDTPPSDDQWAQLETKLSNLYQRGHLSAEKQIELVKKARDAS